MAGLPRRRSWSTSALDRLGPLICVGCIDRGGFAREVICIGVVTDADSDLVPTAFGFIDRGSYGFSSKSSNPSFPLGKIEYAKFYSVIFFGIRFVR